MKRCGGNVQVIHNNCIVVQAEDYLDSNAGLYYNRKCLIEPVAFVALQAVSAALHIDSGILQAVIILLHDISVTLPADPVILQTAFVSLHLASAFLHFNPDILHLASAILHLASAILHLASAICNLI